MAAEELTPHQQLTSAEYWAHAQEVQPIPAVAQAMDLLMNDRGQAVRHIATVVGGHFGELTPMPIPAGEALPALFPAGHSTLRVVQDSLLYHPGEDFVDRYRHVTPDLFDDVATSIQQNPEYTGPPVGMVLDDDDGPMGIQRAAWFALSTVSGHSLIGVPSHRVGRWTAARRMPIYHVDRPYSQPDGRVRVPQAELLSAGSITRVVPINSLLGQFARRMMRRKDS